MKKTFKTIGIIIGVIVVVILLAGFMFPGFLWKKPLGVTYSTKDYKNANEKFTNIKEDIKNRKGIIYQEFTSEELMAYINEKNFSFLPIENGEIKLNDNNSIEISAKINLKLLLEKVIVDYTKEQLEKEIPGLGILPNKPNAYIKFSCNIYDNNVALVIDTIQIQGVTIPDKYYNSNNIVDKISSELLKVIMNYNNKNNTRFNYIKIENSLAKMEIETID